MPVSVLHRGCTERGLLEFGCTMLSRQAGRQARAATASGQQPAGALPVSTLCCTHAHLQPCNRFAHSPAVFDKLEVSVTVVEELCDDKVCTRLHLHQQAQAGTGHTLTEVYGLPGDGAMERGRPW